jgi:hypothetical protein
MRALLACLPALCSGMSAADWPGLPTRDQNPLLQGYLIPVQPQPANRGWAAGTSLFITNTHQSDRSGKEKLLIDVENTRLDLQISHRSSEWLFSANLPLIDNRPGQLDRLILDWHDFFGLPQGGRDRAPLDQMHLFWAVDGEPLLDINKPASGIGDLQLSIGRKMGGGNEIWLAIELPGDGDALFSNHGVDLALWWRRQGLVAARMQGYGGFGLSAISNGGALEGHSKNRLWFGQAGLRYRWRPTVEALFQFDWHSAVVEESRVDGLDNSLQGQFGLSLLRLIDGYRLELFFSEDLWPGHAPDISFGIGILPTRR